MAYLVLNFLFVFASSCVLPFILSRWMARPVDVGVTTAIVVLNAVIVGLSGIAIHAWVLTGEPFGASKSPGNWLLFGLGFGWAAAWRMLRKNPVAPPPARSSDSSEQRVLVPRRGPQPKPVERLERPAAASVRHDVPIFIHDAGEQRGPFMLAQIRHMWLNGLLTAEALYFDEDKDEWQPLNQLMETP